MNSCVLLAEIVQEPQLRYTSDNLAVTEMLVQFPNSQKPDDPPATLKVVGWGNLATEIQQNYHQGDRVIIAGRLGMNTIERPEGFKEKRAELTVQQIQSISGNFTSSPTVARTPVVTETPSRPSSPTITTQQDVSSYESPRPAPTPAASKVSVAPQVNNYEPAPKTTYPPVEEPDPDDIPF
ncbi:Single-strand binding protein [Trichormus variabilis ATCC 29413]|uniref:Single-strand binding protein n=2 Tax=Anabaena variabilis TaxID=264691 RepID=Q3MBG8_TRIV2|nr:MULTISPECIES: single-stranded DNA-binding protein [Nostocaceae]ABA21668.1 Single-strand binding protein [Trichormus variabilis ATCC 29413]MBC1217419.1 single-stranded DNA-binding protein [Trichormus variabilis ARAD]MBC1258164.1 single-stranded DNA-binding protein [Trichormus variabilis V5]MBC1270241.1 single-stranded DNA-binding protein [Trichormus variabilis FSR]MBC1302257.1 single-stranded DNA-binding protein [Trichormus variabilis N2B]